MSAYWEAFKFVMQFQEIGLQTFDVWREEWIGTWTFVWKVGKACVPLVSRDTFVDLFFFFFILKKKPTFNSNIVRIAIAYAMRHTSIQEFFDSHSFIPRGTFMSCGPMDWNGIRFTLLQCYKTYCGSKSFIHIMSEIL